MNLSAKPSAPARSGPTLGSRLARRDSARLVGRRAELAAIEALFVDDPQANVVLVHGPGGIGKSTLLREVARRGEARGWRPCRSRAASCGRCPTSSPV